MELPMDKQNRLASRAVQPQKVTVGVRPGYLSLGETGLSATVEVTEMMGSEVHVHCTVNGKDVVLILPTIEKDGQHFRAPEVGEKIALDFNGGLCQLFGANGENLEGKS